MLLTDGAKTKKTDDAENISVAETASTKSAINGSNERQSPRFAKRIERRGEKVERRKSTSRLRRPVTHLPSVSFLLSTLLSGHKVWRFAFEKLVVSRSCR